MAERDSIPADLHEQILLLLPCDVLLNFKRVCKDWNELISSQRFIQQHLRRSNKTRSAALCTTGIDLVHDDDIASKLLPYPPGFRMDDTKIAGSCDGVICLVRPKDKDFAIVNPSTGKRGVRRIEGFVFDAEQCSWFGHHPSTGEYMIVGIAISSNTVTACRFSGELASLQHCAVPSIYDSYGKSPILLHGALHWLALSARSGLVVLAYDIVENYMVDIRTPFEEEYATLIGIKDGCLFAIVELDMEEFEFWIMKDYGVERSWSKYGRLEAGFVHVDDFFPESVLHYRVYRVDSENYFSYNDASVVFFADSLVEPEKIWGEL